MELEDSESAYPEPTPTIINPYPEYASFDPSLGWRQGSAPPVHEGFITREDILQDFDDDPERDPRALASQYHLYGILHPSSSRDPDADDDYDNEDSIYNTRYTNPNESYLQSDLDVLPQIREREAADPDFEVTDDEDMTDDDDMELDDELFQTAIAEAPSKSKRGRPRGSARGTTRGRRGWKWALKGTAHDPDLDKEKRKPGRPKGTKSQVPRGEGRKRGAAAGVKFADPGAEYKKKQAQATQAFLDGKLEDAARFAKEAVLANPEVWGAHSLLSEILQAQGHLQDALTVLVTGAHTKRDKELWHLCAERTLDLAGENRTKAVLDNAMYAYSWAIKLDQKDLEARREKLNLLLEDYNRFGSTNAPGSARRECRMILRERPGEMPVVNTYAALGVLTGGIAEMKAAKQAFDEAIKIYLQAGVLGDAAEQWSYINVYLDLVSKLNGPDEAARRLKQLSRWLLGRAEETYWDDFQDDDREFDVEHEPRRTIVEQFANQERPDISSYGEGLPLEIRIKLGNYRLESHKYSEALQHYDFLLSYVSEIAEYADLFKEVGFALSDSKQFATAVKFLEPLNEVPDYQDADFYAHLADCYVARGQTDAAEDCFKIIIDNDENEWKARVTLAKIYEDQNRKEEALPLIERVIQLGRSDALRQKKIAYTTPAKPKPPPKPKPVPKEKPAKKAVRAQAALDEGSPENDTLQTRTLSAEEETSDQLSTAPTSRRSQKKKTGGKSGLVKVPSSGNAEKLRKMEEKLRNILDLGQRIRTNFETLQSCQEDVDNGDEDALRLWIQAAESMLEIFKSQRVLFPGKGDRHLKFAGYGRQDKLMTELEAMRERLQPSEDSPTSSTQPDPSALGIPDDFQDIKFSAWLDVFCQLAMYMARDGRQEDCYDQLKTASAASVFYHEEPCMRQIQITWLACAVLLEDEQTMTTVCRWFMTEDKYSYGPYQLFNAICRIFSTRTLNWFNAGPTQKFILRAVKAMDYALLSPSARMKYGFTGSEKSSYTNGGKEKPNYIGMEELDPSTLALYGHIMAAASTWASALNYYFRALTIEPENPTLNLCIGLAYVQNALKRQAANRHWGIMQGLSFLNRYYVIRTTGFLPKAGQSKDDPPSDSVDSPKKVPALHKQEAAYNLARAYHLLGLTNHAVKGYERCLTLASAVREERLEQEKRNMDNDGDEAMEDEPGEADVLGEEEEFTQEAAVALVHAYSIVGNEERARRIAEEFLVL